MPFLPGILMSSRIRLKNDLGLHVTASMAYCPSVTHTTLSNYFFNMFSKMLSKNGTSLATRHFLSKYLSSRDLSFLMTLGSIKKLGDFVNDGDKGKSCYWSSSSYDRLLFLRSGASNPPMQLLS